jgi:hypothetical protein
LNDIISGQWARLRCVTTYNNWTEVTAALRAIAELPETRSSAFQHLVRCSRNYDNQPPLSSLGARDLPLYWYSWLSGHAKRQDRGDIVEIHDVALELELFLQTLGGARLRVLYPDGIQGRRWRLELLLFTRDVPASLHALRRHNFSVSLDWPTT